MTRSDLIARIVDRIIADAVRAVVYAAICVALAEHRRGERRGWVMKQPEGWQ